MGRIAEWLLATIGAVVSIGGAAVFWGYAARPGPGSDLWPLPGLVLLEWAMFGLAGLATVALDGEGRSARWGLMTWGVIGGSVALVVLGVFSIGVFVLPTVLTLLAAGILSDRRRGRRVWVGLALAVAVALANGAAVVMLSVMSRPEV